MPNRDSITDGPIIRTVFSLAAPVVLGMLMQFALTTTDYFWVGRLGPTAQDAVTTSMVVLWTIFAVTSVISIGLTALVSRHIGARNPDRAAFCTRQGLALALLVGLSVSVAGVLLAPGFLRFMDTSAGTYPSALAYMRVSFAFATMFFLVDPIFSVFRAAGNTRTPAIIDIVVILLNMGLDPLLMFGWGPFPRLGVAGASLATGLSVSIATVWALLLLLKGRAGFDVGALLRYRPNLRESMKIVKIGLPGGGQWFIFTAVYWILIKIVHQYGQDAAAAMGVGNRMESFAYLTCTGFAVAASTMVGQNLGAKKPDRAARCAWASTGLAVVVTLVISVLFLTIPRAIASVFSDDPEVRKIAVDYLMILGLSQITMAIEIVLEGAFSGAGDTVPPMIVMSIGAIIRVPLAYWLCFTLDWGINGVWWTLTFTTTIKAAVLIYLFRRGRWKLKEV